MPRPATNRVTSTTAPWREKQTTTTLLGQVIVRESDGRALASTTQLKRPASRTVRKDSTGWRAASAYSTYRMEMRAHEDGYSCVNMFSADGSVTKLERWGVTIALSNLSPAFPQHIKNAVERKALLKLKDQKVDFSVMAGEVKSTAEMFADNTNRLAGAVRAVRRGDAADALRHLKVLEGQRKVHKRWNKKTVPQRWLEIQYGVIPVVKDIQGAAELLAEQALDPKKSYVNVRSQVSEESQDVTIVPSPKGIRRSRYEKWMHSARIRLTYEPDPKFSAYLARWGLSNPAATIFELLPYSLVLDWILPIGNWLQALDADNGYTFKGGSASLVTKTELQVSDGATSEVSLTPAALYVGQISSHVMSASVFDYTRVTYGKSPSPWYPSWREMTAPSLKQAANGLSMLVQAFR